MRRAAVLAAALSAALPAAAQQEAPSAPIPPADAAGEQAAAAAPIPPTAPAPVVPGPAPLAPSRWKGWDLSVWGWGGAYSGGAAETGAGGFDTRVVVHGDLLAVGARAGSERVGSGLGGSFAAVGGVMLPVSARTRLDAEADAGLAMLMIPQESASCGGAFCDGRDGAMVFRPEVSARAGFAFLSADGRLAFLVGAFARVVAEERVTLQRRTCIFSSCATGPEYRTVGGKAFGAYLGLGFPRSL